MKGIVQVVHDGQPVAVLEEAQRRVAPDESRPSTHKYILHEERGRCTMRRSGGRRVGPGTFPSIPSELFEWSATGSTLTRGVFFTADAIHTLQCTCLQGTKNTVVPEKITRFWSLVSAGQHLGEIRGIPTFRRGSPGADRSGQPGSSCSEVHGARVVRTVAIDLFIHSLGQLGAARAGSPAGAGSQEQNGTVPFRRTRATTSAGAGLPSERWRDAHLLPGA